MSDLETWFHTPEGMCLDYYPRFIDRDDRYVRENDMREEINQHYICLEDHEDALWRARGCILLCVCVIIVICVSWGVS